MSNFGIKFHLRVFHPKLLHCHRLIAVIVDCHSYSFHSISVQYTSSPQIIQLISIRCVYSTLYPRTFTTLWIEEQKSNVIQRIKVSTHKLHTFQRIQLIQHFCLYKLSLVAKHHVFYSWTNYPKEVHMEQIHVSLVLSATKK